MGNEPSGASRSRGVILAVILLGALGLRLWGNGWGLPDRFHPIRTLHPDEALYVRTVADLRPWQFDFDPKCYPHPNFIVYELAGWIALGHVVGAVDIKPGLAGYAEHPEKSAAIYRWTRIGMAFIGTAFVGLLYLAGRELFGPSEGLWAAAFAAVLPMMVVDAHYVKSDTPMTFWMAVSLVFAARHLRAPGRAPLFLSAAASALAASNKYSAAMTFAIPLAAAWLRRMDVRAFLRQAVRLAATAAAIFIVANPFTILSFFRDGGSDLMLTFVATVFPKALRLDLSYEGRSCGWISVWTDGLWHGAGPAFEAAAIIALFFALRRRSDPDRLLLIAWGVHFVIVGAAGAQFVRFWLPAAAISCLMAGGMIMALASSVPGKWLAGIAGGAILLYSAAYSVAMDRILAAEDSRISASRWIEKNLPAGQPVATVRNPDFLGVYRTFQLPPILYVPEKLEALGAKARHPLWILEMRPEALTAPDRARFAVLSDYEFRDYLRLSGRYPVEAAFVRGLLAERGYDLRARFSLKPEILGLRIFPQDDPPHDWMYAWPEVRIYERSDR